MYIDFEDYRPDTPRVEQALSGGTAVLVALTIHVLFILALIYLPSFQPVPVRLATAPMQQPERSPRFVFMAPRVDIAKPQPRPDVDASDQDRVASTVQRPPDPQNSLPFARGNSPERVEAEVARQEPQASADQAAADDPSRSMVRLPEMPADAPALQLGRTPPRATNTGLGDALRNLQRYVQQQSFDNPQGSGDAQGLIQFDSKGVEFGPWVRRFVAQVKSNWFIPSAAMMLKGHVVITFNVHRNGALTDIEVKAPSGVDAFDRAAVNALLSSNPTLPLPPEYPSESAFFTVTFLYNEEPPSSYNR
jgi:TonB family protein